MKQHLKLSGKSDEEVMEACMRWAKDNLPDGSQSIEDLSSLTEQMGINGDAIKTLLYIGFESGRKHQFDRANRIQIN